jgi:hypothetical protein
MSLHVPQQRSETQDFGGESEKYPSRAYKYRAYCAFAGRNVTYPSPIIVVVVVVIIIIIIIIIRVIKSRMRWAGHVARMEEMKNAYKVLVEKSEDMCVDGRIILEWDLGKYGGKMWTRFIGLRIGASNGSL